MRRPREPHSRRGHIHGHDVEPVLLQPRDARLPDPARASGDNCNGHVRRIPFVSAVRERRDVGAGALDVGRHRGGRARGLARGDGGDDLGVLGVGGLLEAAPGRSTGLNMPRRPASMACSSRLLRAILAISRW